MLRTGGFGGVRSPSEMVINSERIKHSALTRNRSVLNQRIIDKFYMPAIEKKYYQIALNANIGHIKKDTRQSATDNFLLDKKKIDIKKLTNEMILYNNPSNIIN